MTSTARKTFLNALGWTMLVVGVTVLIGMVIGFFLILYTAVTM